MFSSHNSMACPAHTPLWKSVLLRKMETLGRGTIGPKAWDRRVNTAWFSFQTENLIFFFLKKKFCKIHSHL